MKPTISYHQHFAYTDPILFGLYQRLKPEQIIELEHKPIAPDHFFSHLCSSIISQQLSTKVADVIWKRFVKLLPTTEPTPSDILAISDEILRAQGLSWAKVKYIKSLADHVLSQKLVLQNLINLDDETVIEQLIQVKGIGRWTAEMFLMFTLGRPDIFSAGDLGLKNAIKKWYSLTDPTLDQLISVSMPWSPYRTYACRILWKSLEFKNEKIE